MKRFWHTWLAIVATAAMVSSTNAQSNWDRSNEIGSYQSILSRAGYGTKVKTPAQDEVPAAPALVADATVVGQPTQGCATGDCGSAFVDGNVYEQAGGMVNNSNANTVIGARGLFFWRDSEDDVPLTQNAAGDIFRSTNANMNTMGGFEVDVTRRNINGNGAQFIYWGLYPTEAYDEILAPGLNTYQTGLSNILVDPGGVDLQTYFNNADSNYLVRTNEFHNIEANLLRNGGNYTTRFGGAGTFELLAGFRWFQFNENFRYGAYTAAGDPEWVEYELNVQNTLLGFQLGGRSDLCLTDRLSLGLGTKLGVFNNYISHYQCVCDSNGVMGYRTASGVDDYDYNNTKNDLSLLGELDLGFNYRLSCNVRLTTGYRLIGISGIALAPDQIPFDYNLDDEINSINSNGDLILGGGYAGLEYCF